MTSRVVKARVTINMTAASVETQAIPTAATLGAASTTAAPMAAAVQQAAVTTTNSLQKALAELLNPDGTHKVTITMPKLPGLQPRNVTLPKLLQSAINLSFNITLPKLLNFSSVGASSSNSSTIKKDTLKMATDVLQQLAQLQPSLAKLDTLFKNLNNNAGSTRSLLEEEDTATDANATIDPAATARTLLADDNAAGVTSSNDNTEKNATVVTNNKKIAQKINLGMSDGWLVLYSGFKVAQASVQLLAAVMRSGTTGVVSVDPALLLTFADLGSNFSSAVSYLLYSTQKTVADVVTPFGIFKPLNG
ncbi:hypothetical protein OEZ85_009085 [Tetradesmus obliquus]|uniref:Uncharacterized protein n=1 Tax=Tetradesmus obliquus TaxID=3088 RepID=A0ABY8TKY1_TETOB|nr:hypothetical protein OEZ85_009085 [Tetradesmus obliquus]